MRTETKWAVIATVIVFVWFLVMKMLGWQELENLDTGAFANLIFSIVVFLFVYYMVTREKREPDLRGVMSWKQGFWAGAIMTLIFIPISTLLIYIFINSINPEFASLLMQADKGASFERDPIASTGPDSM